MLKADKQTPTMPSNVSILTYISKVLLRCIPAGAGMVILCYTERTNRHRMITSWIIIQKNVRKVKKGLGVNGRQKQRPRVSQKQRPRVSTHTTSYSPRYAKAALQSARDLPYIRRLPIPLLRRIRRYIHICAYIHFDARYRSDRYFYP